MTTPLPYGYSRYAGVVVSPIQRQMVAAGLNIGLSGNALQRELRTAGIGMNRQAAQALIRELESASKRAEAWRYTRRNFKLGPSAFEPTTLQMKTKYRYYGYGRFALADGTPGEKYFVNFGDDDRLTPDEVDERIESLLAGLAEQYGVELVDVTPTSQLVATGEGR